MDANLEIAEKYGVPLHKGVPALAVLDEHGALLYSQKSASSKIFVICSRRSNEVLLQWKPVKPGCSR